MVRRARERCAALTNTEFHESAVEELPFEDGAFDAVVTRLAIHHFDDPALVLREARRVTAPGGRLVVLDILASEDPEEALLHNALETIRDPSHVRLLAPTELRDVIERAGFNVRGEQRWDQQRNFAEWASIVADARNIDALEPVMAALARAGLHAGVGLEMDGDIVRFTHHWIAVSAEAS
jgi:ubiquinone/menaquinone biosynthesis C-methylase UbiE